jgi:hypothetical protein
VDVDVNVDVDEDDEKEEWHMNVEEDDIYDATNINMDEIEDAIYVEEIFQEWQIFVPFINREIKHPCAQFADNTPIPYADEPYWRSYGNRRDWSMYNDLIIRPDPAKINKGEKNTHSNGYGWNRGLYQHADNLRSNSF